MVTVTVFCVTNPVLAVLTWCHAFLQGCGIVLYDNIVSSVAAMTALHNKYHWTGGETTMVVEWADPTRQRKENPDAKGVCGCAS